MYKISNHSFGTFREEKKDGRDYLVVKGVAIVEGVLNSFMVPMDEFGAFVPDWNGVPLVLRHPQKNGGTARVPVPDVPVVGNFYGATLDEAGKRLLGEYWFDTNALLATEEGKEIHANILSGKVIETSTGYYANIEETTGKHQGIPYVGIQHNLHPDHIAILPDEVGACSIMDGCGINRNTVMMTNCDACPVKNMTGNLPAEGKKIFEKVYKKCKADGDDDETAGKKAWGAVKQAGWHKKKDKWVHKNYAIFENAEMGEDIASSSMIAFMLPESVKEKIKEQFPFITDEVYNSLHLTLAFLGDTSTVKIIPILKAMFRMDYQNIIAGKVGGLARFVSGGDQDAFVLTFDSPDLNGFYTSLMNELRWSDVVLPSEHGFIPHITLAYIGKDDDLPANTFEPFDMTINGFSMVNGNEVFLHIPFGGFFGVKAEAPYSNSQAPSQDYHWLVSLLSNSKQEKHTMEMNKDLITKILNEAGYTVAFSADGKNVTATPRAAPLSATLTGLESIVNETGGPEKFKEMLANLGKIPASIQVITEALNKVEGNIQAATIMAQNAAAVADAEKKQTVARLLTNASCPFDEATLTGWDLPTLQKLEASYRPTNYALQGAFVNQTSLTSLGDEEPLGVPLFANEEEPGKGK